MAITKQEKIKLVENLTEKLLKIKIAILINYSGLNTTQIIDLRDQLEEKNIQMKVIKNTLARRACKNNNVKIEPDILKGPVAIIFSDEDEVEPSKIISKFALLEKKPEILGAIYQNKFIDVEIIKKLAKIPEWPILVAQVVGGIKAPISGFVQVLKGNLSGLVSVLSQHSKQ